MFSLIITIVAIALVAALALATLYYGGAAHTQAQAKATASKINLQGQQMVGAAEIFKANEQRWPNSVEEMVSLGYLATLPSIDVADAATNAGLMPVAHAAVQTWVMPIPGKPIFSLSGVPSAAVCQEINRQSFGVNGILVNAYDSIKTQCFGGSEEDLSVLTTSTPGDLATEPVLGQVVTGAYPTDPTSSAWFLPPGESVTPAPDTGSGGGGAPIVESTVGDDVPFAETGSMYYMGPNPLYLSASNPSQRVRLVGPSLGSTANYQISAATEGPEGLVVSSSDVVCTYDGDYGGQCDVTLSASASAASSTVVQGAVTLTSSAGTVTIPVRYSTGLTQAWWVMRTDGSTMTIRSNFFAHEMAQGAQINLFGGAGGHELYAYSLPLQFSTPTQAQLQFVSAPDTPVAIARPSRMPNPDYLFPFIPGGPRLVDAVNLPAGNACLAFGPAGLDQFNCSQFSSHPLAPN